MAIVFDAQSDYCMQCELKGKCAVQVKESLMSIHQQTDVADFLVSLQRVGVEVSISESCNALPRQHKGKVKPKKRTVSSNLLTALSSMPKGAKTLSEKILSIDEEPKLAIHQKRNPFIGVKPEYLAPVFDLLISNSLTRDSLISCLIELNSTWSKSTVRSHYYTITNALCGLDIAQQNGTKFELKELQ